MNNDRELDQLIVVAEHYLKLANEVSNSNVQLERSVGETAQRRVAGSLGQEELLLAHLASCGIRLATICEKRKQTSYRKDFYDKSWRRKGGESKEAAIAAIKEKLDQHIQFLLRDDVSHYENDESEMATDRRALLESLTMQEVLDAVEACTKRVRETLSTD